MLRLCCVELTFRQHSSWEKNSKKIFFAVINGSGPSRTGGSSITIDSRAILQTEGVDRPLPSRYPACWDVRLMRKVRSLAGWEEFEMHAIIMECRILLRRKQKNQDRYGLGCTEDERVGLFSLSYWC
jgi:hypothetical protein